MSVSKAKYLIIIAGPTGIGKSSIAMKLARHFETDIVGADSRQLYKEMFIGTAKPNQEERTEIKHHLVHSHSIQNPITAAEYEFLALRALDHIFNYNQTAILCGGTGLYIKAVIEGLNSSVGVDEGLRNQLEKILKEQGILELQKILKEASLEKYEQTDLNNPRRLIRAIEILQSSQDKEWKPKAYRDFKIIPICLEMDRSNLYDRINMRVDRMISQGLVKEVESLRPYIGSRALDTVGYKEIFHHLAGKNTLEEAIELIKRNSRRYAKRQMTWFRNQGEWNYFSSTKYNQILNFISSRINTMN